MRYDNVIDLPASPNAADHDGGVHRAILNSIDQGYCMIEVAFDEQQKAVDYCFLEVSPSFERQTGIKNAAGRWMREIAPDQDQFWFDTYGRVALTGEPEQFENFSTPLDRWWSVYAFKIDGPARVAVLFDDITDRKRAEAALRASEERFRGFVTASADAVYRMSPDWSQMRQLDGQGFISNTPEPSEGWMDRYILPEDRDLVQRAIDQAIRTKSQFDLEHRVIRADGTPGWTSSRATPMLDEHGEIIEWLGTASDITQAKGEREALRESELCYRTLFEAIDSGFCIFEMIFGEDGRAIDYRFVEVNPAFERQSGLVDAVGRRIREFAPDLEGHWFERYGRVALTGESLRIEGEAAPLGRWFDINAFRVGNPEQRRVAVLFTDISARRNAEIGLRESEQQFETLLNQAPLGVYLVDGDLVIRQVNPVALPVFGDIAGGPIGRDFDEIIHLLWDKEYADEVVGIFRHTLETGEPYVAPERTEYRVDRDIVEYYEWRVDRIPLAAGRHGVVCYFRDVSEQVEARKEIEKAREFALVSEARQAFLLKLSDALHPLGDPLEVQTAALCVLGEHLAVNRAFFNEVDEARDTFVIHRTYANGVAPLTGHFRLSDIQWTAEFAGSGQIVVLDDVGTDPRLSKAERATYAAMDVAAGIGVPLIKDGRWVAGLGVHHATPRHWTPEEIDLVRETAERTWAAVERARAETALRESERRAQLLLAELQHRVRNILTMVRSVARRTAENCEDVDDYVRHLDGRLSSLARVQTIVTRDPARGVNLHDMVLDELRCQTASPAQYQIDGPEVELSSKAAEVLSLAVHELATNSTKYGVLSVSGGMIRIRWATHDRDGLSWLRFTWTEPLDRKIGQPARTGFGTDLLRQRVPYELYGTGDLRLEGGKVEAVIDFPLANEKTSLSSLVAERSTIQ